jgi:Secretion system C-terminal sorting domain
MKLFFSLILIVSFSLNGFSQCTPDTSITHNQPGTYPDSATGLPHAITGLAYSTVIQIKVLTDSTVGGLTGIVDSIVVDNVIGLPNGFTYACSPTGCSFPGGSDGCITLSGPGLSNTGNYPLTVQSTIYYKIFGTPQSLQNDITGYTIVVDTSVGISFPERVIFSAGQSVPNPARDFATIPLFLPHSGEVILTVSNLIGKQVLTHAYYLQKGKANIQLDLHGLQPGIYMYSLTNGANTVTRRMIVSND